MKRKPLALAQNESDLYHWKTCRGLILLIGLAGGLSGYGYAEGNALLWTDFFGLAVDINLFPEGSTVRRCAGLLFMGVTREVDYIVVRRPDTIESRNGGCA
jgi:hypothetical protein